MFSPTTVSHFPGNNKFISCLNYFINSVLEESENEDLIDDAEQVNELSNPSGIIYSLTEIAPALRRRNILRQLPRTLANPSSEFFQLISHD